VWRRYRGRLAGVVAGAAGIVIAAVVVLLSFGGDQITPGSGHSRDPLDATVRPRRSAAAQPPDGRQSGGLARAGHRYDLQGLKVLPGNDVY
jgi:hypothetical protein